MKTYLRDKTNDQFIDIFDGAAIRILIYVLAVVALAHIIIPGCWLIWKGM